MKLPLHRRMTVATIRIDNEQHIRMYFIYSLGDAIPVRHHPVGEGNVLDLPTL
jgi:hypothetical protein